MINIKNINSYLQCTQKHEQKEQEQEEQLKKE